MSTFCFIRLIFREGSGKPEDFSAVFDLCRLKNCYVFQPLWMTCQEFPELKIEMQVSQTSLTNFSPLPKHVVLQWRILFMKREHDPNGFDISFCSATNKTHLSLQDYRENRVECKNIQPTPRVRGEKQ